jgi:hypothetical protein
LSFGITTLMAMAVYLGTIAPEVTLEDGGTFVTGAVYAGVPDCPGFPVWTIYSWLFVKLIPFSNDAWRVTVGSAWAAALACGLTALMVSRGGPLLLRNSAAFASLQPMEQNSLRVVCGCVAGLAFGLCEAIWSEVARLNIWALSMLLFAAILAFLMRWTVSPQSRRFLYAAVFLFGLLLTNSQFLIAFAPAFVLWVMVTDSELGRDFFLLVPVLAYLIVFPGFWDSSQLTPASIHLFVIVFVPAAIWAVIAGIKTRRIGSEWRPTLLCGVLFMAGLGPYLYSALASMTNPPLNWAYPRTVEGFYHLVSRGQYDKMNPNHDLRLFISQLGIFVKEVGRQFGWLYAIFIPLPFLLLRRASGEGRKWVFGLMAAFISTGPVIVAMLNPTPDRVTIGIFAVYLSAVYVVLAVWTGLGLMIVGAIVGTLRIRHKAVPTGQPQEGH